MEQEQHLHAKGYLYTENLQEEMEEGEEEEAAEVGLQRRASKPKNNLSMHVGEESDSSSNRSSRGDVEELIENLVPIQDVRDGVVNAASEEVQAEPEPEPEIEGAKEAETDEGLTKEESINGSPMGKTECRFDGEEHKGAEEDVTIYFNRATVHFEDEKGFESIQAHHETEKNHVEKSVSEAEHVPEALGIEEEISDAQRARSFQIINQHKEISGVANFADSEPPSFTELHKNGSKHLDSSDGTREDVDIDVIEEVYPEQTEFDVERVLEKQNTHDLFCPNCHSCITRRVILCRKKRKIRNLRHKSKDERLDKAVVLGVEAQSAVHESRSIQAVTTNIEAHGVVSSEIHAESTPARETQNIHGITATITEVPAAPASDQNINRDPEVFRCLSCFSFFIPTGNGFKLFKIFGVKDETQTVTDQQEIPAAKRKTPFFSLMKKENITEQETQQSPVEIKQRDESVRVNENLLDQNDSASPIKNSALPEQFISSVALINDAKLADQNGFTLTKDATSIPIESLSSEGIADDANTKSNKNVEDITGYGTGEALVKIKPLPEDSFKKLYPIEGKIPPVTIVVGQSLTDIDPVEKPKEMLDEIAPKKSAASDLESVIKSSALPLQGLKVDEKANQIAGKKLEDVVPTSKGENVIVVVERGQPDATVALQQPESTTASQEAVTPQVVVQTVEEPSTAQAQDTRDWDVLKSIVYGGLVESITSLSIISSAAGSGAKTLNTLALGLANLIGGLFIIAHNLRELKESSVTSSGSTVQDRYYERLGRRDNFCLHATVVILSFIIFGSVAPITYAFSFRVSDNRDYKLAVVAAASLFCILMLAIGKAHVRTPPKSYFKTISYYVTMGLMASGVSFLVGELLDYLLEKFGWFDSSSTVTGALVQVGTAGSGWASY